MPFVSFNLRSSAGGSQLRSTGTFDTALRGDGYIPPSIALSGTSNSVFGVNVLDVTKADGSYSTQYLIEWALGQSLVASVTSPSSTSAQAVRLKIVVSSYGEPITVLDGYTVNEYDYNTITNSYTYTSDLVTPGNWAYFALFFEYEQTINGAKVSWYERLVTLSVQVPYLHGSTDALWRRIPEYYRQQDEDYKQTQEYLDLGHNANAPSGFEDNGPFYRYLNLIGWEIDRTRTLIDSLFVMKDPQIAKTEALERLCKMMGTEVDTVALGAAKARAVLDNIGYLRRRKGTAGCAIAYINALTGCAATYSASANAFTVYTQRANLIPNPRFVGTNNWYITSQYGASVSSASAGGPIRVTTTSASATKVALQSTWKPPVNGSIKYYMSITSSSSATYPSTVYGGAWSSGASWNSWASVTTPATYVEADGRRYYEMPTATSASYYPVLVFKLEAGESAYIDQWMVEPNNIGSYFDGSTYVGGYARSLDTTNVVGTSDFRWGANSDNYVASNLLKNNEFSYYTLDYAKSKAKVISVLQNNILPLGSTLNIIWNALP